MAQALVGPLIFDDHNAAVLAPRDHPLELLVLPYLIDGGVAQCPLDGAAVSEHVVTGEFTV